MGRAAIIMAQSASDADQSSNVASEDELILTAIRNNDHGYLMELLDRGCSPMGDQSKPEVTTPLDLAIKLQNLDMVRILLGHGACYKSSVRTVNPTALHCAVLSRQKASIRQLLNSKVDWSRSDGNGATVLHMVFEMVEVTLDEDEEEEEEDDDDDNDDMGMPKPKISKMMDFSLEQQIIEILTIFLNLGSNVNAETSSGETPLFLALKKGMIEVAGFLIERGANVHVRDNMGNSLIHLLINDQVDEPELGGCRQAEESLAQKNNATFIKWLLSKGVNPNYKNARGEIPILLALEYKLRDTLLVLLKHVNVNYVNDEGQSWLHVFAKMYQGVDSSDEFLGVAEINDIIEELLSKGAPVNGVDRYGQTLFHAAIQMKNTRILRTIAERFDNVLARNSEGEGVLHALVSRCIDDERRNEAGYAEIARVLAARGAPADRRDKRGLSALHLAAQYKYAKIVRAFAEAGADLGTRTDDGDGLLHIVAGRLAGLPDEAAAAADAALVSLALAHGCEPEQARPRGGWTPLHVAAASGNLPAAGALLSAGARVDCRSAERHTPLHLAAMRDDGARTVALLAAAGADPDAPSADSSSPLHLACKAGAPRTVESLLRHGADATRASEAFATPLHLAALGRQPEALETLELLVRAGADLNAAPGRDGATPLHWLCASAQPSLAVARRLLELGADAGVADRRERASPLHVAVRRRQPERLLRLLVRHGAGVEARRAGGDTPLHDAARFCVGLDDHSIPLLLELGARPGVRNAAGLTPLQCALRSGSGAGVQLLLRFAGPADVGSLLEAGREMPAPVSAHLARLRAADLPPCEQARLDSSGPSDESALLLRLSCDAAAYAREVQALKAYMLDDQVSLYRLLHMGLDPRFVYLKNKSLDLPDIQGKFPNYYGFVWQVCLEARERKSLLESAGEALNELSKVHLPEVCVQCVFRFLNNECLKNMVDAATKPC